MAVAAAVRGHAVPLVPRTRDPVFGSLDSRSAGMSGLGASLAPDHDAPFPTRPIRLFARPEPIDAIAEVPDGPPAQFNWRRMRSTTCSSRRPRAHRDGMVARRGRPHADARLFPRRKPRGRARLAVPRMACTIGERCAALVPARRVRMSNVVAFPAARKRRRTGHAARRTPTPSSPSPPISRSCAAPRIRRSSCSRRLALGLAGIGIADRNSVAGVVRAYRPPSS